MNFQSKSRYFDTFAVFLKVAGCSVAWLSRLLWEQKVASSNLATPTLMKSLDLEGENCVEELRL